MAEDKPAEEKFDIDGNPVVPTDGGEGGEQPPKKTDTDDAGTDDTKDAEPEIPVRRSVADEIIARKDRKIKKLESKEDDDDRGEAPKDDADDTKDDDKLTDKAQEAVTKEVKKQVEPMMKSLTNKLDEDELQELLTGDDGEEAKKYEKKIRTYMNHPKYDGVPPEVIFHHLAYGSAQSKGGKRKSAADLEAGQMSSAGSSDRGDEKTDDSGVPTVAEQNEMSDEEFEKLQHKARSGGFVTKDES